MRVPVLFGVFLISGCAATVEVPSLNPFGSSDAPPPGEVIAPLIRRDRVAEVESLEIGRGYRGVLVQATGLAPAPGYNRPELILAGGGKPGPDGVLELDFVARPPESAQPEGGVVARRMTVALFLDDATLAGVRSIRVLGTGTSRDRPL